MRATEAYLLDEIGRSYNNRGERSKALEFYKQALPLRSEADPEGMASTLANLGMAYGWIGDNPFIFLDTAKIRSLGWAPTVNIRDAVVKTLQWLEANQ